MDILTRVPYVRLLRVELAFPRIATVEEIDRLYAACEKARLPRTCVPAPEYWRAAIVVLWNCGPRASDVFLLRPEEIDFEKRQLRFTARKSKRLQAIPLNETTIAHLRAIWSSRQFMFPLPKSVLEGSNGARGEWKRLQQIAGITPPLTFQALRKTCASLYTEHFGRDVASYLLGHAVPGVTATWYSNPTRQIVHAVNNLPQPESFKTAKTFCVWRPSRRTDFLFQPGSVCYRDRLIRLPPKPLAILQALVAAGRPLTTDELKRAAFWNDPGIRDRAIFRGLRQLRAGLAKALRLPEGWDPVRSDRFGSGGWILILPTAQGDAE